MTFTRLLYVIMAQACLLGLAAPAVHAEGTPYAEDGTEAPKPKPTVRRKKPAAKPVAALPAAPVSYTAYKSGLSAEMTKALTPDQPAVLAPLPPPVAIVPAPVLPQPITTQPVNDPPPPAPVIASPDLPPSDQINLKCETQVTDGRRFISQGIFYIDLFPSPVFPDEHADFKFLRVDPTHQSLIRQSVCLDMTCPANVTGAAYYLVNRVTKHGSALRITIDRANGAFYAEEIEDHRVGTASHRGEKGYCTPQKKPATLF